MPKSDSDTTNRGENGDREDEWTERINAHHPVNSGDHKMYARAMELVGNRHSKAALVDLVNFLLRNQQRGGE